MYTNILNFKNKYRDKVNEDDENTLFDISQFLKSLNISKKSQKQIKNFILYHLNDDIDIAIFFNIFSRTINLLKHLSLLELLNIIKDVQAIYIKKEKISLSQLTSLNENKITNLLYYDKGLEIKKSLNMLNNNKYLSELRFAAALVLNQKEYTSFINPLKMPVIKDFNAYNLFNTYSKLRYNLSKESLVFWDIFFANEYLIELNKLNINIKNIKTNINDQNYSYICNYKNKYVEQFGLITKEENITKYTNNYIYNPEETKYSTLQLTELYDIYIPLEYFNQQIVKSSIKSHIEFPKLKSNFRGNINSLKANIIG